MYIQSFCTVAVQLNHTKLFDVLTSLPESHAILRRVVWFVMSLLENHATCSYTLPAAVDRHLDQSKDVYNRIKINTLYVEYII